VSKISILEKNINNFYLWLLLSSLIHNEFKAGPPSKFWDTTYASMALGSGYVDVI